MSRIIDLTLTIDSGMSGVAIAPSHTIEADGWNATTLNLYSHSGTHMDAPRHFLPDGVTIDRLALEACMGPARVLNITPIKPRDLITLEHFGDAAGDIQRGDRLLLRTDWHKRYGKEEYRNQLPRISIDLAKWLADRGVRLIGVEPPSVADVNNMQEVTDVHRVLLGAGIVIVEGLANLDQIAAPVVQFVALPLKIRDGDGTPVRAIAIEDSGGE